MISSRDYIIKSLGISRILTLRNLMYFHEHGIPMFYDDFKPINNISNLATVLKGLSKEGLVDSHKMLSSHIFSPDTEVLDGNTRPCHQYFLTRKGIEDGFQKGLIESKPMFFREFNTSLYTFINVACLQQLGKLTYIFDTSRMIRSSFSIHELHAHLSLGMFSISPSIECIYKKMNVGIKFIIIQNRNR